MSTLVFENFGSLAFVIVFRKIDSVSVYATDSTCVSHIFLYSVKMNEINLNM